MFFARWFGLYYLCTHLSTLDDNAELLADALKEQCTTSTQTAHPEHTELIDREVERRVSLSPLDALPPFTTNEVEAIYNLQPRKAPGFDGIRNPALKILPLQLIAMLATILNAAMTNCIFPVMWKEADIFGIHKLGKPKNKTASYRPISLLPATGKIYKRLLRKRIWTSLPKRKY